MSEEEEKVMIRKTFSSSMKMLILLHYIIQEENEILSYEHVDAIISWASNVASKAPARLASNSNYFIAGKIYLTVLLLICHKPKETMDLCENKPLITKNIFYQIFKGSHFYNAEYDIPLLVRTMITLIKMSSSGASPLFRYSHLFLKLCLECM